MPDPASPRKGKKIDRKELRRRREDRLAKLVAQATRALEPQDKGDKFDEAQEFVDEATLLSPDDPRVAALWKRLDAERPARVKALLEEARTLLEARSLEAAATCADRAVDLQPDSRPAQELRSAVRARLNAGSRRAQAGWRIAAGVVVGVGSLVAATLALLPDAGPQAAAGELVASGGLALDAGGVAPGSAIGGEPGDTADGARDPGADPPAAPDGAASELGSLSSFFAPGRIDGTSLTDVAGAAFPEEAPAGPAAAPRPDPAPAAGLHAAAAGAPRVPAAPPPAAAPPPPAPIVVARLCDDDVACGALRVRVEPAATILFNGVQVGSGAQGMLRLPAGRHQIRLRSDEHEFRRMMTIARGAPATLEVDLADEGLPLLPSNGG